MLTHVIVLLNHIKRKMYFLLIPPLVQCNKTLSVIHPTLTAAFSSIHAARHASLQPSFVVGSTSHRQANLSSNVFSIGIFNTLSPSLKYKRKNVQQNCIKLCHHESNNFVDKVRKQFSIKEFYGPDLFDSI